MHLAILTQYYPPETGAPQARLSELAHHFVQAGHTVTVLTAMPNYPKGKIHDGYGGLFRIEQLDGVKIIRTFIYPTQKTDLLRRLSNYFSFVFSSAILGSFFLKNPDYIMVESPPLFLGFAGYWLKLIKRSKLIFNVSDLWPESAVRLSVISSNGLAHQIGARLEAFFYHKSWLISGQSRSILSDIIQRFPTYQTYHLSNGVDTNLFSPDKQSSEVRKILADDADCVVIYAGLHGIAQGLNQIVEAATLLQDDLGLKFVLIGDGPEKLSLIKSAGNLKNITFLESLPKHEIPTRIASADIVVVPLKMYIPGAVPSKLYEAMASRKPVILIASGEAADIINDYEAGIVVEPGHIEGMVSAIRQLREHPELCTQLGNNGQRAVQQHFDRRKIVERFIEFLESHL